VDAFAFDRSTGLIGASPLFSIPMPAYFHDYTGTDQLAVHPQGGLLFVSQPGALLAYETATGAQVGAIVHPSLVSPTGVCIATVPHLLVLRANQHQFRVGETVQLGFVGRNPGTSLRMDFYLGAVLPDGQTLAFVTHLAPLTFAVGDLADPRSYVPLLVDLELPTGFEARMASIFSYTFGGGEVLGRYSLFAALAHPGVFADGVSDPGDIIAIASVPIDFVP
jgi:hypothetical protein